MSLKFLASQTARLLLYRQAEVSVLLIRKGCDIDAKNNDGQTASHKAALAGLPQVLWALLNRGADFNAQVSSSVSYKIKKGRG